MKPRILVSAYAVSPIRGSECAVGWEICTRLAKYFDVSVLMCEASTNGDRFYEEVENYLQVNGQIKDLRFYPVNIPYSAKKHIKLHDLGFWPAFYWAYNCWQKEAYQVAKTLNRHQKFDLIYQLNMIGFREPGYLWKLNLPFFWGPTNGFHSIPYSFIKELRGKEKVLQTIKHFFNNLQIRISNRPKLAARKAKLIWCVDQLAFDTIKSWGGNTSLLQETGLTTLPLLNKSSKHFDTNRTLNLVWSGKINSGKALRILLTALTKLREFDFKLNILGDGELKSEMEILAKPIANKVNWLGWVERETVKEIIADSDLLIFTSLKEATSVTIMEALGYGVPVMCHDTCGMGIVINDKNGFKIPYKNINSSINFIENNLIQIFKKPEILNEKFYTIWDTVDSLTWDNKVERISKEIYDNL